MTRATKIAPEELDTAAEILEGYEPAPDDEAGPVAVRVAAWLRAEAEWRRESAAVSEIVKRTGVTRAQALKRLREIMKKERRS